MFQCPCEGVSTNLGWEALTADWLRWRCQARTPRLIVLSPTLTPHYRFHRCIPRPRALVAARGVAPTRSTDGETARARPQVERLATVWALARYAGVNKSERGRALTLVATRGVAPTRSTDVEHTPGAPLRCHSFVRLGRPLSVSGIQCLSCQPGALLLLTPLPLFSVLLGCLRLDNGPDI